MRAHVQGRAAAACGHNARTGRGPLETRACQRSTSSCPPPADPPRSDPTRHRMTSYGRSHANHALPLDYIERLDMPAPTGQYRSPHFVSATPVLADNRDYSICDIPSHVMPRVRGPVLSLTRLARWFWVCLSLSQCPQDRGCKHMPNALRAERGLHDEGFRGATPTTGTGTEVTCCARKQREERKHTIPQRHLHQLDRRSDGYRDQADRPHP